MTVPETAVAIARMRWVWEVLEPVRRALPSEEDHYKTKRLTA